MAVLACSDAGAGVTRFPERVWQGTEHMRRVVCG